MLARDRVVLIIGGRRYTLRPTVQAAIRLEYGYGMPAVLKGIADGSAVIMATVIRETADMDHRLGTILDDLCAPTMAVNMTGLREVLAGLVLSMYGIDPDAEVKPVEPKPGAEEIPAREHLTELYRKATGWMGWSPSIALNATPFEIAEAFKGHVDMLTAIHGGKDSEPKPKPKPEPVDLDAKAKAIFGGLAQRFRDRNAKAA